MNYAYTKHARETIVEREIKEEWVSLVIKDPIKVDKHDDGTEHYLGRIEGRSQLLRVVVNVASNKIVTCFFDRRARTK